MSSPARGREMGCRRGSYTGSQRIFRLIKIHFME
jgi:hypothetical protein